MKKITRRYDGHSVPAAASYFFVFIAVEFRGSFSATSNNIKLAHWPMMGGLLHVVQQGGD